MVKIAFIVISLVKESENVSNEEIEKEINKELETGVIARIPWAKEVEKITVAEI